MKSSIKNLIDTLKGDSKELEEMILERIKTIHHLSDEGLRQALIEDPYTLELSLEERRRFDQHFRFLTKPLYLKPNETTLYFAQTAGGGKNGLGYLGGVQSPNPTSSIAFGAHNDDNFSTQKR